VRRREFIKLAGGAVAWPLPALAQRSAGELPRVGTVYTVPSENTESFFQGLRDSGYVDGQNIALQPRYYGSDLNRLDEILRELITLKCKVIFANRTQIDNHYFNSRRRFRIRSRSKRICQEHRPPRGQLHGILLGYS
jgi:hypothetical protein